MVENDSDLLELLRNELSFIEQGGYGRSVRSPWQAKSIFQDSLSCLNYGYPYRAHPCGECQLIDFVSEADKTKAIPCHHIRLNSEGDTVADLEDEDNQRKLEQEVKEWLHAKIKELEERAKQPTDTVAQSPETSYCCKT